MKDSFLLDPGIVYLNHGSFGACPRPVFDVYQEAQRELERRPVEFLALEHKWLCAPKGSGSRSRRSTTGRRCANGAIDCSPRSSSRLPRSPTSTCRCAGFVSTTPDPPGLKRRLYEEHRIEVPVAETPAGWVMRVSVQAYNDESDLEALAGAVGS